MRRCSLSRADPGVEALGLKVREWLLPAFETQMLEPRLVKVILVAVPFSRDGLTVL